MNLALITSRFSPESSPSAKRATELVGSLRSAGHRLTVLTQLPNYPDPSAFDLEPPEGTIVKIEHDACGYEIWRVTPRLAPRENLAGRLFAEACFAVRVSRPRTGISGLDGVVSSTPFIFNLVAARTYRVPMWLDVRDLTWEYAANLKALTPSQRLGVSSLRRIALSSLKKAAAVSTTTECQRQYLIAHGVPAHKVEVFPNGVPRKVAEELGRPASNPKERDTPVNVVYAGLLGFSQGLEFVVESMKDMAGGGIELHLFGDGVDRPRLEASCRSRELRHIHFHGHVPYPRYLEAIIGADILVCSLRPEITTAMPSKIWEYMAAGKPVLFAGTGEAAEVIATAEAGATVDYGEMAAFREHLRRLASDAALRRQLGANGRRWVLRHRIREEINQRWVERMEEVLGHRTAWSRSGASVRNSAPATAGPGSNSVLKTVVLCAASVAETTGLLRLLDHATGGRADRLAILAYHRITEEYSVDGRILPAPCPGLVSASPEGFASQMDYLKENYRVISIGQVLQAFRDGHALPPRSVLLTFDDAYRDFADHAWPVLKRHGLPVTLFVPTAYPGEPDRMFWWDRLYQTIAATEAESCVTPLGECVLRTPAERVRSFRRLRDSLKELSHAEAMGIVDCICNDLGDCRPEPAVLGWDSLRSLARDGVTLGPHTRTHALLDRVSRDEARAEVSGALADLEREIGRTLPIFAYPGGRFSDETVEVLREEKVELAVTTRGGVNDVRHHRDALRLRRIHVGSRTTPPIFRTLLLGLRPPDWVRRC